MDRSLIEKYADGASVLFRAVEGLTAEDRNAHPVPNTWSIQQIVFHVWDSDLVATDRMKRVIAMDRPLLIGYDETAFANVLGYETMDPQPICELFEKNRIHTAEVLRKVPDEAFQRFGIHNESGKVTLEYLVKAYIEHLDHHMKFVRQKREMLGKPMG